MNWFNEIQCSGPMLFTSDLCPGDWPMWYRSAVTTMAHGFCGLSLAIFGTPRRYAIAIALAFTFKELFGDIPNANFALLVIVDGVWDVLCLVACFHLGNRALKRHARKVLENVQT